MNVFLDNFTFIWINSFLAIVAVAFGWLMVNAKSLFVKILSIFFWLIFLPNTIYIITDISHLIETWSEVDIFFRTLLIIQYAIFSIFGIITFMIATYFFQKLLKERPTTSIAICVLNFVVGFGIVLGGIQRTNSWHIFTDPLRVMRDVIALISSPELLALTFGFGLLANAIYFLLAKITAKWYKNLSKK